MLQPIVIWVSGEWLWRHQIWDMRQFLIAGLETATERPITVSLSFLSAGSVWQPHMQPHMLPHVPTSGTCHTWLRRPDTWTGLQCYVSITWSGHRQVNKKMHTSEWKMFNWFNWSLHFIANKYSVFVLCILRVDIAIQCGIEKWSIRDLETFSQRLENFLSLNIWAQSQVVSLPKALGSRRILTKDIRTGL